MWGLCLEVIWRRAVYQGSNTVVCYSHSACTPYQDVVGWRFLKFVSCCYACCAVQGFKTLLTDSEDASFLFNTILDAVVDRALPVVQVRQGLGVRGGGGVAAAAVAACNGHDCSAA